MKTILSRERRTAGADFWIKALPTGLPDCCGLATQGGDSKCMAGQAFDVCGAA